MIYLLCGEIQSGKTTALMQLIKGKKNVYGILSPINENNNRYFFDIETKTKFQMEANLEDEDIISVGRYHFLKSSFELANDILSRNITETKSGYIVIDELGKLELKRQGLHDSAKQLIERTKQNHQLHAVLVVRKSLIEAIKKHYGLSSPTELTIEDLHRLKEM